MSTARSATVEINWRPCLNFYESGVALLRQLDDQAKLRRFRVDHHQVAAILTDGSHLEVGVTAFSYSTPAAPDLSALAEVVAPVLNTLQPVDIDAAVHIQHLRELPGDAEYVEACKQAVSRWLGPLQESLGLHDTAVLADGTSLLHGIPYQVEFGIVNADEIDARLARDLGRTTGPTPPPGWKLGPQETPDVALFVDSSWFPRGTPESASELTEWVMLKFQQVMDEAGSLADIIFNSVSAEAEVR